MRVNLLVFLSLFFTIGIMAETKDLEVKKSELREDKGFILFEPARDVMRSKYDTYVFKKKQFVAKVGKLDTVPESFTLEVDVKPTKQKVYKPKTGAAPEGGIRTRYYDANIIQKKD